MHWKCLGQQTIQEKCPQNNELWKLRNSSNKFSVNSGVFVIVIDCSSIDFYTNVSGVLWLAELEDTEIKLGGIKVFNVKYLPFLDFIIRQK